MKPKHCPDRWSEKHGAIYYQVPKDARDQWDGKAWFRLGATEPEAFATWYGRQQQVGGDDGLPSTISAAIDMYVRDVLPKKAPLTQQEYTRSLALLRPVFGHMRPAALKPKDVYRYMSMRPDVRG